MPMQPSPPNRLTVAQRNTLATHLEHYPNPASVIHLLYPRLWRAARAAGLTPDDILGACHDGLMSSAAKWKGQCAFKTFAAHGSRWAVLRAMSEADRHNRAVGCRGESVAGVPITRLTDVPQSHDPARRLVRIDDARFIARIMRLLNDMYSMTIAHRFGLIDGVPLTLDATGKLLHVTRERVRQIEIRAVRKLRKVAEEMGVTASMVDSPLP